MQGNRQEGYGGVLWMSARLYLVPYSQCKCIYHGIMIMSRKERKLDRLKMNSKGATNEAPTCAVPMHAPQTSSFWQGVGRWTARVKWGVEGGYNQGSFWKLAKGWVGLVNVIVVDEGLLCFVNVPFEKRPVRERWRISHWNWKLWFVPRILKYPPEKLSFHFPLNSGLGVGVVRGLQILIINIVWKYFTWQAFSYNFANSEAWVKSSKRPKPGNERPFIKVIKGS